MASSEDDVDPNAARDIVIAPGGVTFTVSMGTPTVTVEAVAAAAKEASAAKAGQAASFLGIAGSILGVVVALLAKNGDVTLGAGPRLWVWPLVLVILMPFVSAVFYRRRKRSLAWSDSVRRVSRDPGEIGDPVIRRLVEEIALGGPYPVKQRAVPVTKHGDTGQLPA